MYFQTVQDRKAWIDEKPENAISFAIQFNRRGAYDVIQKVWPGEFPLLEKGAEEQSLYQNQMANFLYAKMQRTADHHQFAVDFANMVPASDKYNSHDTLLIK